MLKRGYQGTYHQMSVQHLHRYVNEFSGRHNDRPRDTADQMTACHSSGHGGQASEVRRADRKGRVGENMMVKQTRHIFEVGDILQIRIRCSECGAELTKPRYGSATALPEKCPYCLYEWWDNHSMPVSVDAVKEVLKSIERLQVVLDRDDCAPVTIRFEIDGEEKAI